MSSNTPAALTLQAATSAAMLPAAPSSVPNLPSDAPAVSRTFALSTTWQALMLWLTDATDRFIPASCVDNPEESRRATLIGRFGFLGAAFGGFYAAAYLLIGHPWGAFIIVSCSTVYALAPWIMRRTGSLDLAGHLLSCVLVLGFSSLCCIEGGLHGHSIAWLSSVPLCSLLLLGRRGAGRWMIASFGAGAVITGLEFAGVPMKPLYDPKWENLVSGAGYLGFILFLFMLGVIFETGRRRAMCRMQDALAELEASNAELCRLNQEKNEFLGIAAHDLKNPLAVVIGTAELLRICKDPAKTDRLAGNIVGAGGRMLHLIKNLLDANAIEQGRFTSNLERCDLLALARECLDNNLPAASRKEIQLTLAPGAPCWVKADRNATLQILDNLVSNAIKYSPPKTTVHVTTHQPTGAASCIFIRDEGPGIDEADQKKMFGKFTRLTAKPTGGESSNGLGLSIVKRLAEAMSGQVRCESRLGEGATFILQLPRWQDAKSA